MIAVIFEFTPAEGRFSEYMDLVATFKADLELFGSLQFWRDEQAVQSKGRAGISKSYACASRPCCAITRWTIAPRRRPIL